jgi:hypothetical protein
MNDPNSQPPKQSSNEETRDSFLAESRSPRPSFARELLDFVLTNKKWWLVPIIVVLLGLSLLVLLSSSGVAPLLYPLF